jgi:hypothetical protein
MALEQVAAQLAVRGWAAHRAYWIELDSRGLYGVRMVGSEDTRMYFATATRAADWIDRRMVLSMGRD